MHYLITRIKAFVRVACAIFCFLTLEGIAADINLAWDPNSESNLSGYRIYYGSSSGNYTVAINLGNQTAYSVTGLGVGTYYFVVTAYNTAGLESNASNEVSATVGVPSVPGPLTLVATPGSGSVTVSWSGVTSPTQSDWIGRYSTGANDGSYGDWKYTNSCSQSANGSPRASGSCTFTTPAAAGTYEFRLFANGSYVRLGISNPITVSVGGGDPSPTLTATPSSVTPGGAVALGWSGVGSASVTDWIGRFNPGAANNAYSDWKYTSSCTQSSGGTARSSGSCTFTMPQSPGTSEFRLFTNGTYTRLATSSPVNVGNAEPSLTASPSVVGAGGTIALIWGGINSATAGDWIGLYPLGGGSGQGWIYTSSCSQNAGGAGAYSGSCAFTMPNAPGAYEFRLFGNNGYTLLAKSGAVSIN